MNLYATVEQLTEYMRPELPPANATSLIRSASILIRDATRSGIYKTDSRGMPTSPAALEAFADATCEMVSVYHRLGIDPSLGQSGDKERVSSKSLGPASISYASSESRDAARAALADGTTLTNNAFLILKQAGLITNRVGYSGQETRRGFRFDSDEGLVQVP